MEGAVRSSFLAFSFCVDREWSSTKQHKPEGGEWCPRGVCNSSSGASYRKEFQCHHLAAPRKRVTRHCTPYRPVKQVCKSTNHENGSGEGKATEYCPVLFLTDQQPHNGGRRIVYRTYKHKLQTVLVQVCSEGLRWVQIWHFITYKLKTNPNHVCQPCVPTRVYRM